MQLTKICSQILVLLTNFSSLKLVAIQLTNFSVLTKIMSSHFLELAHKNV